MQRKFILLNEVDGSEILVNIEYIISVFFGEEYTEIEFQNGCIQVTDDFNKLKDYLRSYFYER